MTDPFRDLLYDYGRILNAYREDRQVKLLRLACDIIPQELMYAAGIIAAGTPSAAGGTVPVFDFSLNLPGHVTAGPGRSVEFAPPAGWGDFAHYESIRRFDALLKDISGTGTSSIDTGSLRNACSLYCRMRRTVRGIRSARRANPGLLSNADLFVIYEAAFCLPPEEILPLLEPLLAEMNEAPKPERPPQIFTAMISSPFAPDPETLDSMEDEGVLIAEDHTCAGARLFDISYNADAADPLAELIHAFTFKVYCHHVRPVSDRYELLYKMLRTHNIDCVFFMGDAGAADNDCGFSELAVRLMRSGVDPVFCTPENAVDIAADYAKKGAVTIS
jgi:hypothetical protein